MQQPHESVKTFYSRIREAGAMRKFNDLEEDLVKYLFISNKTNTSIQLDLLSEIRTPQQVLNFGLNRERERGQANHQEILKAHTSITNWSNLSYIRNNSRNPTQQRQFKQPLLPTPTSEKIETFLSAVNLSLEITSTCAKPKTSHAKYARKQDAAHLYAKHLCPKGEKHSHPTRFV